MNCKNKKAVAIPARLLLSFSVYTNGRKLLNTNQSSGSITSINGIQIYQYDMANIGTFGVDIMKRWTFTAISNALVSVDTFFTLSGFLLAYLILKEMKKKDGVKGINWGLFYFHRFWSQSQRLTPAYMLILFVSTATSPYWSDGPMWNINSSGNDNCNKWWWTNLLYINNIVKSKEMRRTNIKPDHNSVTT
ncbi:hypothetical protein KUTeg_018296 [Tegillarca granosa]|uniref:Uncharacterized protein n=1 Tax=Tegillarca granosa TaxID=220873 RepID=A0ABQ9EHH0_TEGGR|nr:hypothetical protein KUTeg_018296 [Tegillarca granosa]